jgi:hypothetical protein
MTDTITEARINRTIQTLTSLALDLAASVRTIAQRNP